MSLSRIETQRLILRRPEPSDIQSFRHWLSDPVTAEHVGGIRPEDRIQSSFEKILQSWKTKGFGKFVILLKSTGELIGLCGISDVEVEGKVENDLGYIIAKEHWGQGFATEAAGAVMNHADQQLGLDLVTAWPNHKNIASVRIVERLGFKYEKQVTEKYSGISFYDMSLYVWQRPKH